MGFKHVRWENIPWEKLRDDVWRRAVFGEKMTVAQLRLRKGAKVAMHSHVHEQTAYVVEGKVKFVFEDRLEQVVEGGGVIVIPSNLGHAAEALEDSLVVDVFAPPREDWIKGDDSYLRKPV